MAFDLEAKLSDVLAGGYYLSAKLEALLRHPLDGRSQEEAMALSQEISRVFMASMFMLKPHESNRVSMKAVPEIRTGDSFGVCTPAKDKRINKYAHQLSVPTIFFQVTLHVLFNLVNSPGWCYENGSRTSHKNIREEEFITKQEITSSPHSKDGYQWRKYGQKNIQNCSFSRYYYKCSRDRDCNAKKKVQRQNGSSEHAPMFEVTYVNHHTCHDATLDNNDGSSKSLPTPTTTENTSGNGDLFDLFRRVSWNAGSSSAEEEEAIVSCLAKVISGTAPSHPSGGPAPAAYVPQLVQQLPPSALGSMADWEMVVDGDTGFSWDDASSSFRPGEVMDLCCDVHMDVAGRFVDTVWPQYHT
ncbi:hypothetical protein EJB05_18569, partial [Eragrostis curvula]